MTGGRKAAGRVSFVSDSSFIDLLHKKTPLWRGSCDVYLLKVFYARITRPLRLFGG